jgi:DinB superfamily
MKHRHFVLIALCVLAVNAFAADPAPVADKAALIKELQRTEARLLADVAGLSDAQWNYKPAADRWSVAECMEHITASEPFIRKMIADAAKTPLADDVKATAMHDEKILKGLVDRSQKFKAPEPLIPTNRFGNAAAAVEAFKKERAETIKLASDSPDLRANGSKHFIFGPLDTYGWFLFLNGHSERHTLQIEEVKASEGFPK